MKRTLLKLACIFTCTCFLFVAGTAIIPSASGNPKGQVSPLMSAAIDPPLEQEMKARPGEEIPVIIELKDQPKPFSVAAAKLLAQESHPGLIALLQNLKASDLKQHWIINAISTKLPAASIYEIAAHPNVARIWLDKEIRLIEPLIASPTEDYGDRLINAPAMWERGFDGRGIRIAILDTGIDNTHPDLKGKVVAAKDFTDDKTVDDLIKDGHGTQVAGIAAGKRNMITNVSGVAPAASLINAKVVNQKGKGQASWLISGIEWSIEQNAHILNMSLGWWQGDGSGRDPGSQAVTNAVAAGYLVVAAAGNEGPGEGTIGAQATAYSVIAVAASDKYDAMAKFSSRGPTGDGRVGIDLVAPGVDVVAPVPRGGYKPFGGTSAAAPHVAGAAALLLQASLSELPKPTIVSRTEWGGPGVPAQSPHMVGQDRHADILRNRGGITHVIIHHTDPRHVVPTPGYPSWAAVVRSIWHHHTNVEGWGDIGYHFLIDPDGKVYQGRSSVRLIGAHTAAKGGNFGTVGIAFLGDFNDHRQPTNEAINSAVKLIAWLFVEEADIDDPKGNAEHAYAGMMPRIGGHRDYRDGKDRDCPGNNLYNHLPTIRQNVSRLLKLDSPLTPAEIERALKNSADDLGHHILEQGTGRLDVKKAHDALTGGVLVYPHEWYVGRVVGAGRHVKSFTLVNKGDEDVSLKIARTILKCTQDFDSSGWIDAPSEVFVLAGGTATFDVEVNIMDIGFVPATYIGSIKLGDIIIPISVNIMQRLDITRVELVGTIDESALGSPIRGFPAGDWIYHALDVRAGTELKLNLTWTTPLINDLNLYLFNPRGELEALSTGVVGLVEDISLYFPMPGIWTVAVNANVLITDETYFLTVGTIAGRVIYVPDNYPTIQLAVKAASPGDRLIVRAGTYTENVKITKSLIIESERGPGLTIVRAANSNDHVFHVKNVDHVKISGFTIRGARGDKKGGISLERANHSEVVNNICSGNWVGIGLFMSYDNIIRNNILSRNRYGIGISEDKGTCAVAEVVYREGITAAPEGILNSLRNFRDSELNPGYVNLFYKYSPEVTRILIAEPSLLMQAATLILKYMPAVRYVIGEGGEDLEITEEDVSEVVVFIRNLSGEISDRQKSIGTARSSAMIRLLNEFEDQVRVSKGQRFSQAFRDSVYFAGNEPVIELHSPAYTNNIIYLNNFVKNTSNVSIRKSTNTWNSAEKMPYVYQGNTFEGFLGNYWDKHAKNDANRDGITDAPYIIDANNRDNYPLMKPFENYRKLPQLTESVDIRVYYAYWEYDIKTTRATRITWHLYNARKDLVHTYESEFWATHHGGIFGGYIPGGEDGYIHLKVVSQDGKVEWWPSEGEMPRIERPELKPVIIRVWTSDAAEGYPEITEFPPGTPIVYVNYLYENPIGSARKIVVYDAEEKVIYTDTRVAEDAWGRGRWGVTFPDREFWPGGSYRAELFIDDVVMATVTWTVQRLAGDATGDGRVDAADLAAVAAAFNSRPGSPNWNPAADLNQDGIVDIFDLVLVGRNFGKD